MNYILLTLEIQCGEYEFKEYKTFTFTPLEDPCDYIEKYMINDKGCDYDRITRIYSQYNSKIAYRTVWQTLTKQEYEILNRFI